MDDRPLFTEPVVGYRWWRLSSDGTLIPRTFNEAWQPGVNTARCMPHRIRGLRQDPDPHHAPSQNCDCGIYAMHELDVRPFRLEEPAAVVGAIVAWGDLEVHADGFRAEHARVVALAYTLNMRIRRRQMIRRAALAHGCEYVLLHHLEETAERYGQPLPASARPELTEMEKFAARTAAMGFSAASGTSSTHYTGAAINLGAPSQGPRWWRIWAGFAGVDPGIVTWRRRGGRWRPV